MLITHTHRYIYIFLFSYRSRLASISKPSVLILHWYHALLHLMPRKYQELTMKTYSIYARLQCKVMRACLKKSVQWFKNTGTISVNWYHWLANMCVLPIFESRHYFLAELYLGLEEHKLSVLDHVNISLQQQNLYRMWKHVLIDSTSKCFHGIPIFSKPWTYIFRWQNNPLSAFKNYH